ncbi:MAG TPA: CRISPR-associated protein Cas5 [Candidatus Cloacimonetes bacterium]|nr:CRISPR-associated protein Cas5 [Candidatus Cloacimonadota bacterium]
MSVNRIFDTLLELKLTGKFAHFRKFYTNASSLTYSIPPRTVVCGLIASILMYPRDSYYDALSSENLGVAIRLPHGTSLRKQFHTLNYVGNDKLINDVSMHKQCRLEMLMSAPDRDLEWTIYLGFNETVSNDPDIISLDHLKSRIQDQNLGYDVYLGQKQFRGNIKLTSEYSAQDYQHINESDYVDSVINKDQVNRLENEEFYLSIERMPLEQALSRVRKVDIRRTVRSGDILIETTGNRLRGDFSDLLELNDDNKTRISFL